jgi:putative ABC transport system substrate-binding protein
MQFVIRSARSIRWRWVVSSWFVVLALLLSACSAEQPKVYRVGVLSGLEFTATLTDGFKAGMIELGYVEGKNIVYDVQTTNVDIDVYRRILQGFVADEVDLILAFPTEAAIEAKAAAAAADIPVIFDFTFIEGLDLVDSVREPGGNITGVRHTGAELALKRFEVILEITPEATQILVPYLAGYPNVLPQLEALRPVAAAAGVTLVELPSADAVELEAALQARTAGSDPGVDAIVLLSEPLAVSPAAYVVLGAFAFEHELPIGGALLTKDGNEALFNLNVDPVSAGRQAAPLADKILKGVPAGTIPVVSTEGFLQINSITAQKLGITVPEGLLSQANEIIR